MKIRDTSLARLVLFLCLPAALICFDTRSARAQTAGGTQIDNTATATYADTNGNNFSATSNTVTVTVANVSGLSITPDAGTNPTAVPGQTGVLFTFRVTNLGNFADQVRFAAAGQSLQVTGQGTLAAAVIDANGSGAIDAGDTDILTNGSDVISASVARSGVANNFFNVLVRLDVDAAAAPGSTINVQLGDAAAGGPTFDNQASDASAREVRTVTAGSANGLREARGDGSIVIENDVRLQLTLTAPSGPVDLGSDITYVLQTCNTGARQATAISLGGNTGVYIVAPVPVGTTLKPGQSFPANTLYTASPLSVDPRTATWSSAPPGNVADTKRVAFKVGDTLAAATCGANVSLLVTVRTDINASVPVDIIADTFGQSNTGAVVTDQSGDTVPNAGDGNANFNEGSQPGNTDANGVIQQTILRATGGVLNGPQGQPTATGPNGNNDDYTNRSVAVGLAGVPPGGGTTAAGVIVFTNTVLNSGNANDTYTLSAQSVPANFTAEISVDGGTTYVAVGGANTVSVPVAFGATANYLVRVTAPAGTSVLAAYDTVLRATSTNTPSAFNDTIDRLYTGFVRLEKSSVVINQTGVGGATDPVPGALVEYVITYTNLSSAGGTNSVGLTASNVAITEDGNAAPNNWGTITDHVVGSASDTRGGTIAGDQANSTLLTDTLTALGPGESGVFRFRRKIK